MLVPLNTRLTVPAQLFVLRDAGVTVLFIATDFVTAVPALADGLPHARIVALDDAASFNSLPDAGNKDACEPQIDFAAPLLIVYAPGTTGRRKGAALTHQAVFCGGVMSHHMHAMTPDDHVPTMLPFFHVGGLNIQTMPALRSRRSPPPGQH